MQLLEFIESSNSCTSEEELILLFERAILVLGFDKFVYSRMRGSFSSENTVHHGVARSYPEEWMRHYSKNNYLDHDPTYRQALSQKSPFTWKKLLKEVPLTKKEILVLHEAEEVGLKSGVSLSVHGPHGEVLGFGFASTDNNEAPNRNQLSVLYALANQFHLAYSNFQPKTCINRIKLSDKQRQLMQWMAAGKSRGVAAEIMGISDATVDDHLKSVFKKLNCNHHTTAVLKAIQLGLIRV